MYVLSGAGVFRVYVQVLVYLGVCTGAGVSRVHVLVLVYVGCMYWFWCILGVCTGACVSSLGLVHCSMLVTCTHYMLHLYTCICVVTLHGDVC